jgi:hypothetical protein
VEEDLPEPHKSSLWYIEEEIEPKETAYFEEEKKEDTFYKEYDVELKVDDPRSRYKRKTDMEKDQVIF